MLFLSDYNETLIFSTEFRNKKYSDKFNKKPSSESRVAACEWTDKRADGQKDRHDEADTRFSQFCERAK